MVRVYGQMVRLGLWLRFRVKVAVSVRVYG